MGLDIKALLKRWLQTGNTADYPSWMYQPMPLIDTASPHSMKFRYVKFNSACNGEKPSDLVGAVTHTSCCAIQMCSNTFSVYCAGTPLFQSPTLQPSSTDVQLFVQ